MSSSHASVPTPMRRPSFRRPIAGPARIRGVGLIEVLISVLILGIGLLGIAAMQSLALRGGQGSLESSQAVMQTNSIIEAMRANRANAADYVLAGMQCSAPTAGTLAQNDVVAWITALKATIPGGITTCGQIIALPAPNAYRITVQWDDQRAGGEATRQIVTETLI